jgi:3-oxoadipate enol-lactonase
VTYAARTGGGRIAYDVTGDAGGPPLLLISPLAGSIELWGRFREELAPHARVIAFDHRALGASDDVSLGVTTRELADDARAVLDAAGVARADVFGLSLGGMVATWLAAEHPARVQRLVLASTLARGAGLARSRRALVRGARLASCVVRPGALGTCLGEGLLSEQFQAARPEESARIERTIAEAPRSRASIVALGAAAIRHDARRVLARITSPVLALAGALDPLITARAQRRAFAALPDVTFDVIAGAGHALDLEAPAETAARIVGFLRARLAP